MLLCLRVRNFAIIDELEVDFRAGLNVVTGETGAGKSILINALGLVLGGRASSELVRSGAESAEVEALFDIGDDPQARERAERASVATDRELVLRRVIDKGGRTRAYANGRMASAGQLAELAEGLVNISSQHEHHTLVDSSSHLFFLDAFAGLDESRKEVASAHGLLQRLSTEHEQAVAKARSRAEREDLLRYQTGEIKELSPQPGEIEALTEERDRQRYAEKLVSTTGRAEEKLYSGDGAVCEMLARVASEVREVAAIDPALAPLAEQLAGAGLQLEEAARELGSYAHKVVADPQRLTEIEERLSALERLRRKYGGSIESILEHQRRAEQELQELAESEERIEALQAEVDKGVQATEKLARALSAARRKAAEGLGRAITAELESLGMGDAKVVVEVEDCPSSGDALAVGGAHLSPTGIDRVEFLIATNRGEEPRPLGKIASGGELSRAMLAVKRVLAGLGPAGLYVFDEVDAGIGGAVAEVIGRKLQQIARHHQVICITHLPQIAVFADAHFFVHKAVTKGRTRSQIKTLTAAEQRDEIARMLGGIQITDKTRAAAAEMLRSAKA
jgi:DNA repair protein RecN (Recombination protein N)